MNVHPFFGSRIVGGGRSLRWRGRNREEAKEGGENYVGKRLFWVFRRDFIRLFCAVGIKEADIKASYPRGSFSFQR